MDELQTRIQAKGEEILRRVEALSKRSLFSTDYFSKDYWYGSVMEWSMKNDKFKTNMFRFVDVLPTLTSGSDVARHLREYFEEGGELPSIFKMGLGLGALAPGLMANTIKKNVSEMAKMFIAGSEPKEALAVLVRARKNRLAFTADLLGEATLSEREAADYQRRYLELIDFLAHHASEWSEVAQLDRDHQGPIPRVNVSVKLTALSSHLKAQAWEASKAALQERLRPLLRAAMQRGVFLNLDMEDYHVKTLTLEVFYELVMEEEFRSYPHFGCVIQAYLRDSLSDIDALIAFAKRRGTPFTVRLVKGAYWDAEAVAAEQRGWPIPVYTHKAESDANFEACAKRLIAAHQHARLAVASHNVRSIAACLVMAESAGLAKEAIEIQMLYGMAEPIKRALAEMGYRVREYAPVGEMLPGMAYLVRRLLENTSNESWLRGKFAEGKSAAQLLRNPAEGLEPSSAQPTAGHEFGNAPLLDFSLAPNRQKLGAALDALQAELPREVRPVIGGTLVVGASIVDRPNPSRPGDLVARVHLASREQAESAVQAAHAAFPQWRSTTVESRAQLMERVASFIERQRFQLIATQVVEVGKPWVEADADVAEAIDFCRYYAAQARTLSPPLPCGHAPGEDSRYFYRPRGVCAAIAPWNFPLAILTGQVAAALVTGNTVVIKPAEQSCLVAKALIEILQAAGCPPGAAQFLPGLGEEVGAYLVAHPHVATIAFTGSKAVGLEILRRANEIASGQTHLKRCIVEMGGKNAIIVDSDADLDEAVSGVLHSAFGFSGQKCSAASRCIVLEEVYERFAHRLVEAARSLLVLPATDPRCDVGPVVDSHAHSRLNDFVTNAAQRYQVLFAGHVPTGGYFVPPTIFGDVDPADPLAQEELFGPVIALIRARSLDAALEIANGTAYALTGGLFSRSPANIQRVRERFEVGNLYINRSITGAMVHRHPFGGFKMSGTGPKTGGPDYLRQFVEPVVITENTMRRGFAPAE